MSAREQQTAFFVAVFFLGWSLTGAFVWIGGGPWTPQGAPVFGAIVLLCPAISAVLVQRFASKAPIAESLGLVLRPNRWLFLAWAIAIVIGAAVGGIASGGDAGRLLPELVRGAGAGATLNALFAAGEEIGWRGFLFAHGRRDGLRGALRSGGVQALWLTPLAAMGSFDNGTQWIAIASTWGYALAVAPLAWHVREKSGSTWTVCVLVGTLAAMDRVAMNVAPAVSHALFGVRGLVGISLLVVVSAWLWRMDRKESDR